MDQNTEIHMTCRHLTQRWQPLPLEIGGSPTPKGEFVPSCYLGRDEWEECRIIGWATKCEETPHDGPCWVWQERHGKDEPDEKFNRG